MRPTLVRFYRVPPASGIACWPTSREVLSSLGASPLVSRRVVFPATLAGCDSVPASDLALVSASILARIYVTKGKGAR
jgi:hypothetical protein